MVSRHSEEYSLLLERLRAARKDAGLTQRQVAEQLGLSQSKVARTETGETKLDPIDLASFCRLYGKPATYFVPDLPA